MTRGARLLALAALWHAGSAVAAPAAAAPAATASATLPAGHPAVTTASGAGAELPSGHPSVAPSTARHEIEPDGVYSNASIPDGTIEVRLVNEKSEPLASTEVTLGVQFQKISEGEQRSEKHAQTDQNGRALFSGLTLGGDFSYRISTRNGPAVYSSEPIQLKAGAGAGALLHVYPYTRNVEEASIGARGFVYVETRDDVFQFEVLFRYFNMGGITWVPEAARMQLPSGYKAFKPGESMDDSRFEEDPGHGARLVGTLGPGQHNVSFRFQLPRHGESSAAFRFGLPPHTAEIRFIAEAAPSMQLDVEDWEKPQIDVNQSGQRVVVTRRVAKRGEPPLTHFSAELSGIPTPRVGRWIAALIALAVAGLGVVALRGSAGAKRSVLGERDAERAEAVLLNEVVELTRARQSGVIGPSTYESARRVLIDALSRIVSGRPERARKPRRQGGGGRSSRGKNATA